VLYFAYGSNMHKSVFQGRRMIKPAESLPAKLPGWRLTFNQPGLPYSEPAFAAVEPVIASGAANGANGSSTVSSEQQQQQPEVHGVVHRITPSQWNYVLETEGASSQDEKSESGYRVVKATAVAYDGTELPGVMTLSVHEKTKARLRVGRGRAEGLAAIDEQRWRQRRHVLAACLGVSWQRGLPGCALLMSWLAS
jgi:hypothetical protein